MLCIISRKTLSASEEDFAKDFLIKIAVANIITFWLLMMTTLDRTDLTSRELSMPGQSLVTM